MKSRYLTYGLLIPAIVVILDQASKYWATRLFDVPFNICAINPFPGLTKEFSPIMDWALVCNQGVSWGMLQAIGNGIDRAFFGAVTDFIDFGDIGFHWVFNIADSAITMGVIGLLLSSYLEARAEKAAAKG